MPAAAIQEVNKLQKHVEKGCLSGIPPGRGTNRNENLHKNINSIMTSSQYGVELAYGFLSTCFHRHNNKHDSRLGQERNKMSLPTEDQPGEKFGLSSESCTPSDSTHSENPKGKETLSIEKSDYKLVVDRLTGTSYPQITNNVHQNRVEDRLEEGEQNQIAIDGHSVSLHVLKHMVIQAVLWFYTHACIVKCSSTAVLPIKYIPFMNANVDRLHTLPSKPSTDQEQERVLMDLLSAWNFNRIEVPGDGD